MDTIGGKMSAFMIAVTVVSLLGVAGVTAYYQERLEKTEGAMQDSIDQKENRIEELEAELNETENELEDARLELEELRGIEQRVIGLEARNEDLRSLLTGQVSGAEEAERRRRQAVEELEEARDEINELEERNENVEEDYGSLLSDYETVYDACENAEGCSVGDMASPGNQTSF
jgi:chromosome segregation ATPase